MPAIIDEPTRLDALAQLERNAALSFRNNTRNDYLLRCLLTCRTCGLAMFGTTHHGGVGKPRHRYYECRGKDCVTRDPARPCTQRVSKAEELEGAVWAHVKQLLGDPATLLGQFESLAREAEDRDGAPAEALKAEANLRRLDREEQRLLDAYQGEIISLEELKRRRDLLRGRRQLLESQREQHAKLRAEREAASGRWRDLTEFCARVRSRLDEATIHERQRVLQLVIERIIVGEDTLEIRHVIPLRRPGPEVTERDPPDEPPGVTGSEGMASGNSSDGLRSDGVEPAPLPRHPLSRASKAGFSPAWASETTRLTPCLQALEESRQWTSASDGETLTPSTDRFPSGRCRWPPGPHGSGPGRRGGRARRGHPGSDTGSRPGSRSPRLQLGVEGLGSPADLGGGDLQAAGLLGDGGDLPGRDALDVHLGHGQLRRPLAPDPLLQSRRVELDPTSPRHVDGERPDPGVNGPGLEAEWH